VAAPNQPESSRGHWLNHRRADATRRFEQSSARLLETMLTAMPLSSLILRFRPDCREAFRAALGQFPQLTVVEATDAAVAVLFEAADAREEWHVAQQLPQLPGCVEVELLTHVPDERALDADTPANPPPSASLSETPVTL
jgi:nitrate reductase NapAB chaperone NapD